MGRWARSKALAGASWAVLRHDKELMVLPLVSGIASIAIAATFLVPIVVTAKGTDAAGDATFTPSVVTYALMFLMYLVLAYVTIFFKTALLCGADERMRGGNPSFGSAVASASRHAGRILPWALVSATVSIVLRSLEERAGLLGRIVIGLVGMAWAVVTFLVLPILVFEGVGVGDALKRSASLFKLTWGENLIVNAGIGIISFLLALPALVLLGLGAWSGSLVGFGAAAAVAVVWFIGVACWSSAMSAVFQLALYRFATQAPLPQEFAAIDLGTAFTQKGARRPFAR